MKKEFIIQRQGKDFVLYAGLLDAAHAAGLTGIETRLIQAPAEANQWTAIVHAAVSLGDHTYDGLGDASPASVERGRAPHIVRLAETRAKARALRDALNIGATALEELGVDDDPPATEEQWQRYLSACDMVLALGAPREEIPVAPNDMTESQYQAIGRRINALRRQYQRSADRA